MNTGDRVRILAGRGVGHEGIVSMQNGSTVQVNVPSMNGLMNGHASLAVRRKHLEIVRTASEDQRIPNFRPYRPPAWSVPRAGSDIASRLPSLAGNSLVYPRGLR
jgi:hypothetical protein